VTQEKWLFWLVCWCICGLDSEALACCSTESKAADSDATGDGTVWMLVPVATTSQVRRSSEIQNTNIRRSFSFLLIRKILVLVSESERSLHSTCSTPKKRQTPCRLDSICMTVCIGGSVESPAQSDSISLVTNPIIIK
jgi:hypothetical protein